MPDNDVNPIVAELAGDDQGRVSIQARCVQSPLDGRQWFAGQQFVEILGELAAIGVNVKQPEIRLKTCSFGSRTAIWERTAGLRPGKT